MNKKKQLKKLQNKLDKEWAIRVKILYDNKCAVCGETKMLNAHHIIPREDKLFRHDTRNGIALCPKHHKFSFELSPHKNPFMFFRWWGNAYREKCNEVIKMLYEKTNPKRN